MADGPAESLSSFAQRLDYLFRHVRRDDNSEFTHEEVAQGATAAGYDISGPYVWQLRTGRRTNPTLRHIEGLANFFNVPGSYFLDANVSDRVDAELDLIVALRRAGVQTVALRANGLSPEGLDAVQSMIEHVRRLEGVAELPEPPPSE